MGGGESGSGAFLRTLGSSGALPDKGSEVFPEAERGFVMSCTLVDRYNGRDGTIR